MEKILIKQGDATFLRNYREQKKQKVIWIQEGFTAEPLRTDSGANFQWNDSDSGPKVGVTDQKSEIQLGRAPESEPNRPEKGPEWGLGASTETPP